MAKATQARHRDAFGLQVEQGQTVPVKDGVSRRGTKGAETEVFAQPPRAVVQSNPRASYLANTWSLTLEH